MTPQQLGAIEDVLDRLESEPATSALTAIPPGGIGRILRASESLLRDEIEGVSPPREESEGGFAELGAVLFLLNNPLVSVEGIDDALPIAGVLTRLRTAIERIDGSDLRTDWAPEDSFPHLPYVSPADGTIYGFGRYEQFDVGWVLSLAYFLYYQAFPGRIHGFGDSPQVVPLSGDESVTIAVVGDWGTGPYDNGFGKPGPAIDVINGISKLEPVPDYIVHLGDVYYAGTGHEETNNFLKHWPALGTGNAGRSFTLNSNHEMYDGANGYFKEALGGSGPFGRQSGTSYFALTYGDWILIGLDSAYYASPWNLFMAGEIRDAHCNQQAEWVRCQFGDRAGKNVIALTHHNPIQVSGQFFDADAARTDWGRAQQARAAGLWHDVVAAVGGNGPDYWYCGHVHNGVVYGDSSPPGRAGVRVRLAGHGALPFGDATDLQGPLGAGTLEYYAHTRIGDSPKVHNGFATLRLTPDGGITESFYETGERAGEAMLKWRSET